MVHADSGCSALLRRRLVWSQYQRSCYRRKQECFLAGYMFFHLHSELLLHLRQDFSERFWLRSALLSEMHYRIFQKHQSLPLLCYLRWCRRWMHPVLRYVWPGNDKFPVLFRLLRSLLLWWYLSLPQVQLSDLWSGFCRFLRIRSHWHFSVRHHYRHHFGRFRFLHFHLLLSEKSLHSLHSYRQLSHSSLSQMRMSGRIHRIQMHSPESHFLILLLQDLRYFRSLLRLLHLRSVLLPCHWSPGLRK